MRFAWYLIEDIKDVRWFENLPDWIPPAKVKQIQSGLGITVKWKYAGKSFKYSRYADIGNGIIVITDNDKNDEKVLLHELGHAAFFYFKKDWIKSLTNFTEKKFGKRIKGWSTKFLDFGAGEEHAFMHSGTHKKHEEMWATLFSMYYSGFEFPEETKIKEAIELILKQGRT